MNCSIEPVLGHDGDFGSICPGLNYRPFFNNYGYDKINDQNALFGFPIEQDLSMLRWLSSTETSMGSIQTGPATPFILPQRPMRNIDSLSHGYKTEKRKISEDPEASTNVQHRSKRQRSVKPMARATASPNLNALLARVVRRTKFTDGDATVEIEKIKFQRTKAAAGSDMICCVKERHDFFIGCYKCGNFHYSECFTGNIYLCASCKADTSTE